MEPNFNPSSKVFIFFFSSPKQTYPLSNLHDAEAILIATKPLYAVVSVSYLDPGGKTE